MLDQMPDSLAVRHGSGWGPRTLSSCNMDLGRNRPGSHAARNVNLASLRKLRHPIPPWRPVVDGKRLPVGTCVARPHLPERCDSDSSDEEPRGSNPWSSGSEASSADQDRGCSHGAYGRSITHSMSLRNPVPMTSPHSRPT